MANTKSKKKVNTGDNVAAGPWSDLNSDVLYLVMMQLGFLDYFSFGRVCKSWRSFAFSNRETFMASKPLMAMRIVYWRSSKKECYLDDLEGGKFKSILPHFSCGACVGLTCGYLIFYKRTTHDFLLLNPITGHQIHFPSFPLNYNPNFEPQEVKAILVFSPSISKWVLVVLRRSSSQLWFSEESTGEWDDVSCFCQITDLCAFKGKIYTLIRNINSHLYLCELRLNPEAKLTFIETTNSLKHPFDEQLVSSGGNMYVMASTPEDRYRFQELDFDEMKWVLREKKVGESAAFLSNFKHGVVEKQYFWGIRGQGLILGHGTGEMLNVMELKKTRHFTAYMWYLPHEFLDVDCLDE